MPGRGIIQRPKEEKLPNVSSSFCPRWPYTALVRPNCGTSTRHVHVQHFRNKSSSSNSLLISGRQYYLYGDLAYTLHPYLQTGFRGSAISSDEVAFNASMSKVRVTVEWTFIDGKQYFTHVDLPIKLFCDTTPAGLLYVSSVMLWNSRIVSMKAVRNTTFSAIQSIYLNI